MEILINGKPVDIVLESEKNTGDVLSGLEQWLEGSGSRLSGLCIDGRETGAAGLSMAMERRLDSIKTLDIKISSWDELAMEALGDLKFYCRLFSDSGFEERQNIKKDWEESAAKTFLSTDIKDLYEIACRSFSGEGITPEELGLLADERFLELFDPASEIEKIEKPISETAARMEEFPLDVQTGKDGRAAETIRIFAQMGEKLFRIFGILKKRSPADSLKINGKPAKEFLDEFGAVLGELTAAYGNQDTVLAGDLAEYELAPRLLELYSAIKDFTFKEA